LLGHNADMLVLALDTTTRTGSHALVRDGRILQAGTGAADRPHAVRLPGEVLDLLAGLGLALKDVDAFAVAAGPGSFTGLRIGIASMQGLAFAAERPIVGVSALDGLAAAAADLEGPRGAAHVAVWMDAMRGEVFAALYRVGKGAGGDWEAVEEDPPMVAHPEAVIARWTALGVGGLVFVGDGALAYRALVEESGLLGRLIDPLPPTAPSLARLAAARLAGGGAFLPHGVVPVYVRRPDAELARDRKAGLR
jgi:tRNA threonylcarbamoyladenosine biosynthesis protein TsaB